MKDRNISTIQSDIHNENIILLIKWSCALGNQCNDTGSCFHKWTEKLELSRININLWNFICFPVHNFVLQRGWTIYLFSHSSHISKLDTMLLINIKKEMHHADYESECVELIYLVDLIELGGRRVYFWI